MTSDTRRTEGREDHDVDLLVTGTLPPLIDPGFKRGDQVEVRNMDLFGSETWEPATIAKRDSFNGNAGWYVVRFADEGSLCIHGERMRLAR